MLRLKNIALKREQQLGELRPTGLLKVTTSPYSDIDWASLFRDAKAVDLFFSYARTWRKSHAEELRKLVRKSGCTLRVVLADPEDAAIVHALAMRSSCADDELLRRIYEAALHFLNLAQASERKAVVQIWYVPILPLFSLFRFDNKGVLSCHTHRRLRRAVITLLFEGGSLLEYASGEFEALLQQYSGARQVTTESIPAEYRALPVDM